MNWVQNVKTVSTFPPPETFNKSAKTIAKTLANPKVSPKGIGSAIRMVQYFINRGGKKLSATRKKELEKAKHILQGMRERDDSRDTAKRGSKDQSPYPGSKASGNRKTKKGKAPKKKTNSRKSKT